MISAASLGASEAQKVFNEQNARKLIDFLKEQFALTSDVDFEGLYPLILSLYVSGVPQGIYQFFHDLHVLEKQIQNYLGTLGADVKTAENDLVQTGLNWAEYFHLGGL